MKIVCRVAAIVAAMFFSAIACAESDWPTMHIDPEIKKKLEIGETDVVLVVSPDGRVRVAPPDNWSVIPKERWEVKAFDLAEPSGFSFALRATAGPNKCPTTPCNCASRQTYSDIRSCDDLKRKTENGKALTCCVKQEYKRDSSGRVVLKEVPPWWPEKPCNSDSKRCR